MRLCFVDYANWDYNVDAPLLGPLGGSHSAMCYLAAALAKDGHEITAMTGTKRPGTVLGVECINIENSNPWFFKNRAYDAIIVLNGGAGYGVMRDTLPSATRLILWTQHEPAQPATRKLALPEIRDKWDHIVCVSDWQQSQLRDVYDIKRSSVLRNAIAPCFERLFSSAEDLANAKSNPLTLAYTSTPYRGLHHLLDVFPALRLEHPEARLHVFSSMAVYHKHEEMDAGRFKAGYDALRAMDGVEYVGSLPQPALAERLATSHILAYPNIFPETSCIAVMEAMAAGMRVVTTDFAALPETTEGFAWLVPPNFKDQACYVENYRFILSTAIEQYDLSELWDQVCHMNRNHTWAVRAKQWADYLS